MSKPYVVTDDISHVMKKLGKQGLVAPDYGHEKETSGAIIHSLNQIFDKVDVVPAERIVGYLQDQAAKSDLPVISMTGLIEDGENILSSLCFSRSVSFDGFDGRGYHSYKLADPDIWPRSVKSKSITEQFAEAAQYCANHTDVALIDDVVFSGGSIVSVADKLMKHGIHVKKVYASIVMEKALIRLHDCGIEAFGDYTYNAVTDEVCMRDFVVGCPDGGRNVIVTPQAFASAPYIYPFGDIAGWASIEGANAVRFSRDALLASKALWEVIDAKNGRDVQMKKLAKPIVTWDADEHVLSGINRALGMLPK